MNVEAFFWVEFDINYFTFSFGKYPLKSKKQNISVILILDEKKRMCPHNETRPQHDEWMTQPKIENKAWGFKMFKTVENKRY